MKKSNERQAYIEETGLIFEQMGATRMAGRILGYMMVCDKEFVSFNELTEVIQASKSSISTNVKSLINIGYLRMATFPADRKTYYTLSNEIDHVATMENKMRLMELLSKHAKKGLSYRVNQHDSTANWIKDMTGFYDWMIVHLPDFLSQYKESRESE